MNNNPDFSEALGEQYKYPRTIKFEIKEFNDCIERLTQQNYVAKNFKEFFAKMKTDPHEALK